MKKRLLILGGTGEAARLAERALATYGDSLHVISSLAGRVKNPRPLPGHIRIGGFGGSEGLARYIKDENIDLVMDATHPHAAIISANAREACEQTGTPRLTLVRPAWRLPPYGKLLEVDDYRAAAKVLPGLGQRVFLSIGQRNLAAFVPLTHMTFFVRVIDPAAEPLPIPGANIIIGRPPFLPEDEKAFLADKAIDVLLSKNSGGAIVPAKITAAIEAEIPIVLIARPPPEPGPQVHAMDEALGWVGSQAFGLST